MTSTVISSAVISYVTSLSSCGGVERRVEPDGCAALAGAKGEPCFVLVVDDFQYTMVCLHLFELIFFMCAA